METEWSAMRGLGDVLEEGKREGECLKMKMMLSSSSWSALRKKFKRKNL